ncbi:hypothetical protein VTL71DRAFT_6469 [Oculimacula yallundae]|uniref:DUF7728 domain-containing protein n=1 Tax=Oculimacula yallundae TaxID=86028 RepID=A0ABR4BX22_9HELO
MHFTQLGAVAAMAGLSQAFLIPPEMSSADIDATSTIPLNTVAMNGRVVEISCPGCPVSTEFNGEVITTEGESTLEFTFNIEASSDNGPDRLMLDGVQIYPVDPTQTFMEPLTAAQMVKNADETWKYASNPKLGYSLAIGGSAGSSEDHLHLVAVHLEIIEVANKFVSGIPTIDLQLLETPSGKLMIGKSDVTAAINSSGECTTLLCKWRAIVADRVAALKKGCGGSKRPTPQVRPIHEPTHHFNRPHAKPHGWRHHHRQGTFTRILRGIVLHILVPVLIGVMVGITASLIGMVVGQIVISVWRMLFRRGQNYNEVNQEEVDEESIDDSKVLLESQGPPPQYEDEKKEIL